jgi:hypothetical protein
MMLPGLAPLVLSFLTTPGDPARLERALATLSAPAIHADIAFFADAEMRGRDTPSQEQRVAARFLRARLEKLGLQPGAGKGYFFEYPRFQRRIDPARTKLTVTGASGALELVYGTDYYFPSSRDIASLEREGSLVWCGAGEREDFEKAKAKDRWALCLASELSARRRQRYAESAGVLGIVVVPDPAGSADPAAETCKRTTEYAASGLIDSRPDSDPIFPQTFLSLAATRRLFTALGAGPGLPALGAEFPAKLRDVRAGSGKIALENVCAFWPGSDERLAKEVLIVSAHYDHVGVEDGQVYPGADDNGSGSMGLLSLAGALAEYGPMRRSVLLMWVSGEEKGLWGSAAWTKAVAEDMDPKTKEKSAANGAPAKAPTLREGCHAVSDINIDMIGRNAPDYLLITPTKALREYNGLTRLAEELAPGEGFATLGSADEYWRRSDHMNFADNLHIPVAFLFSDVHADYHKPTDTVDKIDCDKIRRVTRLVLRMLDALQADVLTL